MWSVLRGAVLLPLLRQCQGVSKEAIAHVQCQACEFAVQEARRYAKDNSIKDDDSLADLVDNLCSVKKKEGRWGSRYDIVRTESDGPLSMVRQSTVGECHNECHVVQRACAGAMDGKEEALASLLSSGASVKELKKKICKNTCRKKLPQLGKWIDEVFKPRNEKEMDTEDRLEQMEAETGMRYKVYGKEDFDKMSPGDLEIMKRRQDVAAARESETAPDKEF